MLHAEDPTRSELDTEANQLRDTVRRLVLMKETGPKSAAWHRARVQMIWRLHRKLEQSSHPGPEPSVTAPAVAPESDAQAAC